MLKNIFVVVIFFVISYTAQTTVAEAIVRHQHDKRKTNPDNVNIVDGAWGDDVTTRSKRMMANHLSLPKLAPVSTHCEALEFNVTLSRPHCEAKVVVNRMCYGVCVSKYVPAVGGSYIFQRTHCAPVKTKQRTVHLTCSRTRGLGTSWTKKVHMEQVLDCGCTNHQ